MRVGVHANAPPIDSSRQRRVQSVRTGDLTKSSNGRLFVDLLQNRGISVDERATVLGVLPVHFFNKQFRQDRAPSKV